MIIAVVGPIASGKSTAAGILRLRGFYSISLSDILREEAKRRGLRPSRENLYALGEELRAKYGRAVLAEMALKRIKALGARNAVIESVRWPEEVEALKRAGAVVICIDAPRWLRYLRVRRRGRTGETDITFREFLRQDLKELSRGLRRAMELCDFKIKNTSTVRELEEALADLLEKLKGRQPSFGDIS